MFSHPSRRVVATCLLLPYLNAALPIAPVLLAETGSPVPVVLPRQADAAPPLLPPAELLEPVRTPQNVTVNRTVPEPQSLPRATRGALAEADAEIADLRVFREPLAPLPGKETGPAERKALLAAAQAYAVRQDPADVSALTSFLEKHPQSKWRVSLLTNLGLDWFEAGYFTKAMEAWEEAWQASAKAGAKGNRQVGARALAELLGLSSRLGRVARIQALLEESEGEAMEGALRERINAAVAAHAMMQARPDIAFRCGPLAVGSLLERAAPVSPERRARVAEFASSDQGTSLQQVAALAAAVGLDYQAIRRQPGSAIPVPGVIHWKLGHFAAIVDEVSPGRYLIEDPTFRFDLLVTREAIEEEASGYFLAAPDLLPAGWTRVGGEEAAKVWGRGFVNARVPNTVRPTDVTVQDCGQPARGMPVYNVHAMLTSLTINDIPVGYTPAVGPAIDFQITHIQRDSQLTALGTYSNLGDKWTHNWLSFVEVSSTYADVFVRGGGVDRFTYNSGPGTYNIQMESRTQLVRLTSPHLHYQRLFPDGTVEVFEKANTGNRFFLTGIIDPHGNEVKIHYDSSVRLTSIVDATPSPHHGVTTFAYEHTDPMKITRVTDPFGRSARFTYRSDGLLESVTDVVGLVSQFTYETVGRKYMQTMTTPYGQTKFTYSAVGEELNTWIVIEDPLGRKERTEFYTPPTSDPAAGAALAGVPQTEANIPAGVLNNYLGHRNTFYWDKKAYVEATTVAPGTVSQPDRNKAVIMHWLHDGSSAAWPILESIKRPNETRVWFHYPGQTAIYAPGTQSSPSVVVRMVDDPATGSLVEQRWQYEYNGLGRVTKVIDPLNRETRFTYATNEQDLLTVEQKNGANYEKLAGYLYAGPAHLPTTVTDAAGKSTILGYHANGQLKSVINAKLEVTTLLYDPAGNPANATSTSTGRLVAVDGPLAGTVDRTTIAYDGFGRPRTVTDVDDYAVVTDYDYLDRPTVITYPDNTFEQVAYPRIEAEWMRDRLGRWTQVGYNSLRQVSFVRDAMQRVTSYEWCYCGALQKLTDPMGRATGWTYNYAGQLVGKRYAGTAEPAYDLSYTYDQAGRLRTVTDALSQVTTYKYHQDGALAKVEYTNAVNATPDVGFTYDAGYGRLATRVDGGTATTTYGYHPITATPTSGAGRLATVDGPLANDTIGYTYDELGRTLTRTIDGAANATTYQFDALGRVDQIVNPLGTFGLGYVGATGRLSHLDYPNSQRTNYDYWPNVPATPGTGNGDRRLRQIQNLKTAGGDNLSTFDYTYDPAGIISTWKQSLGTNPAQLYTFGYDLADQLRTALLTNASTGASIHSYVYGYDQAGNRTSDQVDATPRSFTINNLNQIQSQSAGGPVRFSGTLTKPGTVTVAGQPATMETPTRFSASPTLSPGTQTVAIAATGTTGSVNTKNASLTVGNAGARTFAYDANGNMTNNGAGQTYAWDAENRLIKITYTGGASSEFTYNGIGQRVKIVEKNASNVVMSTKQYIWAAGVQPVEERDGSNVLTKRFYQGLGERVGSTNYYYTTDHLRSVREVTDSAGALQSSYSYDLYGKTEKLAGSYESAFGYTGFYKHDPSGLKRKRSTEHLVDRW